MSQNPNSMHKHTGHETVTLANRETFGGSFEVSTTYVLVENYKSKKKNSNRTCSRWGAIPNPQVKIIDPQVRPSPNPQFRSICFRSYFCENTYKNL